MSRLTFFHSILYYSLARVPAKVYELTLLRIAWLKLFCSVTGLVQVPADRRRLAAEVVVLDGPGYHDQKSGDSHGNAAARTNQTTVYQRKFISCRQ